MSADPQLFRINPDNHESEAITEVEFAQLGFQERRDIQEWVANNPGILGEGLLIIGKEFSGFDRTNERLDLLAVDKDGKLVVIELKRDESGADAHWQAIKYASYIRHADEERIVGMLADYREVSEEDAASLLQHHLGADDLNALNNDQRIILASHRFAPEVTSAALWLNEKAPEDNLITCVQLIPYHDAQNDSLYIQANRIIPVPGAEDYMVGIGSVQDERAINRTSGNRRVRANDDITRFMRKVEELTRIGLTDELKPDMRSKYAGVGRHKHYGSHRFYHLWYKRSPWSNWGMSYHVNMFKNEANEVDTRASSLTHQWQRLAREHWGWETPIGEADTKSFPWEVMVTFSMSSRYVEALQPKLSDLYIHADQIIPYGSWGCNVEVVRGGDALDESFANTLADTLRRFIEEITPIVDDFENQCNEEDA